MLFVQRKRQKRKINKDMLTAYLERGWLVIGVDEEVPAEKPKRGKKALEAGEQLCT